jgi:hypothetical protein
MLRTNWLGITFARGELAMVQLQMFIQNVVLAERLYWRRYGHLTPVIKFAGDQRSWSTVAPERTGLVLVQTCDKVSVSQVCTSASPVYHKAYTLPV